jgi:heavy metal sensor kinase
MRFPRSIQFRLNLWFLFFLAIVIFFFAALSYFILDRNLMNRAFSDYEVRTAEVPWGPPAAQFDSVKPVASPSTVRSFKFALGLSLGEDALSKIKNQSSRIATIDIPEGSLNIDLYQFVPSNAEAGAYIMFYYRDSPANPGYVEIMGVTQSKTSMAQVLGVYRQILLIAIPATFVLAALLGAILVRRMLKPVYAMARTAREIQEKDLSRRIQVQTQDELGQLADTLNQTFGRLQRAFERERQFTADASHELRTPLAIVQGEASLALAKDRTKEEYRKSLQAISGKIAQMSTTINKLLELARADSGKENISMATFDLKGLLAEIASDVEILCEEKALTFQTVLRDKLEITGDRTKLRELFLNLLDNAMRYTPQGGKILLSAGASGAMARVSVNDSGIGIAQKHLPHIFERFYRVSKARSADEGGTGLGLAICKHIVELHGGRIEVESREGAGSAFSVFLPLAKKVTSGSTNVGMG